MTEQDKQRLEKEAADCYSVEFNPVCWMVKREGYISGATRENERMAELLKEERNDAIDACIKICGGHWNIADWLELRRKLEALKSKSQ